MDLLGIDPIPVLFLAVFAGWFLWATFGHKRQVKIVVEDGQVQSMQGVAKAHIARVTEFLERDVCPAGKVKVLGDRDRNGVLRISFRGKLDLETQQQIRNYLKLVL